MTKLRLAIIRQKYRADGGAEKFISRLLKYLNNLSIEFNIITRNWESKADTFYNVHICNPKKFSRISRERRFSNSIKKYCQKENFDIIQSHERITGCDIFRAGDGVHRMWLQQRARISLPWHNFNINIDRYHKYVLYAEEELLNSKELKAVICNSEMVRKDILQFFSMDYSKISVIYNAIDLEKFKPASEYHRIYFRQQLNIPQNATVMIFVGSGFERKGLINAIKAIANSDRYLLIVGKDKKTSFYRQLAQDLNCLHRLRFVGIQNNILPFYHASDALLLPTFYDPFPNVILEAMACGLTIITTTTCGGAEFIRTGKEGFVYDALDIKGLTDGVLSTPSLSKDSTMGTTASNTAKFFSINRLAESLTILYQKVINENSLKK